MFCIVDEGGKLKWSAAESEAKPQKSKLKTNGKAKPFRTSDGAAESKMFCIVDEGGKVKWSAAESEA